LGNTQVGNRSEFAVVAVDGFNPERIRNLKAGMETTLGGKILAAAILDKDYRSEKERKWIENECSTFCALAAIHHCKEIENFLLVPDAIDRAAERKVLDQAKRSGSKPEKNFTSFAAEILDSFSDEKKLYVQSQYLSARRKFERSASSGIDDATYTEQVLNEFEQFWTSTSAKSSVIPGKEAMGAINRYLQAKYGVNITSTSIVDVMKVEEISAEMSRLIADLGLFASRPTDVA
jgi:hypothetical protein